MQLEVCIETADDAAIAVRAGAHRLEINAALSLGGVTPSLGLLIEIRRLVGPQVPLIVMIRPRDGDFCYSEQEFAVICRDSDLFLMHGASGIAFGVLTHNGRVDPVRCRKLVGQVRAWPGTKAVFHRAFDFVADPLAAVDELAKFGVARIMSSGQRATACEGAEEIARYITHAAGRVEILPAGGIRPENVGDLIRATGCNQVHASLREPIRSAAESATIPSARVQLGSTGSGGNRPRTVTSDRLVRAMLKKLEG